MTRTWRLLLLPVALACRPDPRPVVAGLQLEPPRPKPDITLTSTDGRPFPFRAATAGRPMLLFFGYTRCPDVCPVHMASIAGALARLPPDIGDSLQVVFVTTDPRRDTPEVMRRWLDHFDRRFIGLRGDSAAVGAAMRFLLLDEPFPIPMSHDTNYTVAHPAMVLGYSRDNLAHVIYPFGTRPGDWLRNIPALMRP